MYQYSCYCKLHTRAFFFYVLLRTIPKPEQKLNAFGLTKEISLNESILFFPVLIQSNKPRNCNVFVCWISNKQWQEDQKRMRNRSSSVCVAFAYNTQITNYINMLFVPRIALIVVKAKKTIPVGYSSYHPSNTTADAGEKGGREIKKKITMKSGNGIDSGTGCCDGGPILIQISVSFLEITPVTWAIHPI